MSKKNKNAFDQAAAVATPPAPEVEVKEVPVETDPPIETVTAPDDPKPGPVVSDPPAEPKLRTIAVVAPSLNRPESAARLKQALAACEVPKGWTLKVNVQRETEPRPLPTIVNGLVKDAYGADADVVVVLADHIVPKPDVLNAAIRANCDCMLGLNIVNMPPLPGVREYCFFAIGREFIERFPGCEIFCPDYHHFYADTELGQFASESGLFFFAEDGEIETFHVNNGKADPDATYRASRSRKREDDAVNARRREAGLLWGRSFERVNT